MDTVRQKTSRHSWKAISDRAERSAGDTLVEVLICIAIVGVVIAGAYTLASDGLHQGITASEHSSALQLVKAQIESLKFREQQSQTKDFNDNFGGDGYSTNYDFCLNTAATGPTDAANWGPISNGQYEGKLNTLAVKGSGGYYDPACVVQGKYYENISVCPDGVPGTQPVSYLVTVRWTGLGGGQNQTQMYYRF